MSTTLQQDAQELVELFSFLEDWEERYRMIIDMGKELEPVPEAMKVEVHRVYGCQSTVYLVPAVQGQGEQAVVRFLAESDAAIVNGLIAILKKVYDGRSASEILTFDIEGLLKQLGLEEHLSMTRRNGLHEMVKRVKGIAAGCAS